MFEYHKINKYLNCLVGFAYEDNGKLVNGKFAIQLYLVIMKGDKYKLVKYKKIKYYTSEMVDSIIDELDAKPISYYVSFNNDRQMVKKRN